ncbi:two-component system protein A [Paraphoma chrysanthemicola]|uniref:Two-component system protein A n=1 Tax=Paraphoma chrysanthemicola TaxID=798071 RepID=A0A8K0R8P5_9PLEO|nr:two-component system protein A [Paraphoma chrysanthemicola]
MAAFFDPVPSKTVVTNVVDLPSPTTPQDGHGSMGLADDLLLYTPVPTLLLDAALSIRQVSESYLTVSGATNREQILGRHAYDIFNQQVNFPPHASARKILHAAQDTVTIQQIKHITDAGRAWTIRAIPIVRHDIQLFQMEFLDSSEELRRQLELEERLYVNDTFRILVETVKDYAIFMLDPNGNVATWNAGAQTFKGYKPSEIIGKHFSSFYGEEDRAAGKPERELRDALREGRCEDEGWRYRSDGTCFWANVVITPIYRGDVLLGFSKVTRDLTEKRKAEKNIISAYEEASKLKSEFLANMSHEIRTPMHGLLSALTLLLDTQLDENQLDLANVIKESGDVLLQVINDILDYSKLASGSFSISHDIINVTDIIQSVFRAHLRCYKPGVVLQRQLDPRLPKAAEGDSLRYRQIIQNFLSNATKFTEEGYIRIAATLENEDENYFTILTKVEDTGIGIPVESVKALFTPFTQFDNSATKRYKGTGLGLSICKSLAELMGGEIGYLPNPEGQGSVFWFTAKLKKCKQAKVVEMLAQEIEALKIPSPAPEDPMLDLREAAVGKRLLLAEDNMINQKIMLQMLAGLGFENMDAALNGKEAVAKVKQSATPYDIILMDVNMPVQDGVSATKELREMGVKVPIVAMTANALKGQAETYIAKGMSGYIAKPVDRNLLVKLLLKCLERGGDG